MTTFLTFSVYSLRVSGDIPVQSEYLPYVLIYFIFSVLNTLLSLFWFVLANHFLAKTILPKFLIRFGTTLKRILFFLFDEPAKPPPNKEADKSKPDQVTQVEVINEKGAANIPQAPAAPSGGISSADCVKCGLCDKCKADAQKEKEKSKKGIG